MPLNKVLGYNTSHTVINGEHFYQIKDFLDDSTQLQMVADIDRFKSEHQGNHPQVAGNSVTDMHTREQFQTTLWRTFYDTIVKIVSEIEGQELHIINAWSATAHANNVDDSYWHQHQTAYSLVYYLRNFDPAHGTHWKPADDEEFMIFGHENSISFFTANWTHDGVMPRWRREQYLAEHPRYVLAAEIAWGPG
jgi:hypothetical protein